MTNLWNSKFLIFIFLWLLTIFGTAFVVMYINQFLGFSFFVLCLLGLIKSVDSILKMK